MVFTLATKSKTWPRFRALEKACTQTSMKREWGCGWSTRRRKETVRLGDLDRVGEQPGVALHGSRNRFLGGRRNLVGRRWSRSHFWPRSIAPSKNLKASATTPSCCSAGNSLRTQFRSEKATAPGERSTVVTWEAPPSSVRKAARVTENIQHRFAPREPRTFSRLSRWSRKNPVFCPLMTSTR